MIESVENRTVKGLHRVAVGSGLFALLAFLAPGTSAAAQPRAITQDPNAERLLVVTFRPGGKPGTTFAEALRERIPKDIPRKQVWPIPTPDVIDNQVPSGFPYDIPLATRDAALLSNRLRAEEFIEGTAVVEEGHWKINARMVLANDHKLVEPLGSSTGRREDHAATGISRAFVEARKSLPGVRRCFANVNRRQYQEGIAAAREAMLVYPQSTLARICLASAFSHTKQPADSILPLVGEIMAMDSTSHYGLTLGYEAYKAKNDTAKRVEFITRLVLLDLKNTELQEQAVNDLAESGLYTVARDLIDRAVAENPGFPPLMALRFKILFATKDFREAVVAGEELIVTDTSVTDALFFERLALSYASANEPRRAAETIERGSQKYPTNPRLYTIRSQYLAAAGDTAASIVAAQKSIDVAPDDPLVTTTVLNIVHMIGAHRPDSVAPFLRLAASKARTARDSSNVAGFVIVGGGNVLKSAREDTLPDRVVAAREQFERAIGWFAWADSLAPAPMAKLQQGAAATLTIQHIAIKEIPARQKELGKEGTCQLARVGQSYAVMAQSKVVAGASADRELPAKLMPVILQLSPYLESVVTSTCPK